MKLALCSIFRDSVGYLPEYLERVRALDAVLKSLQGQLRCYWCEGDSVDRTWEMLNKWSVSLNCKAVKRDTHTPKYGPIETDIRRFQAKAVADNAALSMVQNEDYVCYVESDLLWEPTTILALIENLKQVDMCSPMVWCHSRFRDTWAFRRAGGVRFLNDWPYHVSLDWTKPLIEMESVGSCWAARMSVVNGIEVPGDDEWLGYCRAIRQGGARIWVDLRLSVRHP